MMAAARPIGLADDALFERRVQAGARCECVGECGEPHRFRPELPAARCRAAHGSLVVRLLASPSFWTLAPSEGSGPVAEAELFSREPEPVVLSAFPVGDETKMLCGRCGKRARERGAAPKRGRKAGRS